MALLTLTQEERIRKARIVLLEKFPFWGYLGNMIFPIEDTTGIIPPHAGMGVNINGKLLYKKEFVASLQDHELQFVLTHEIGHLAFGHMLRVNNRDPQLWNVSIDICVNYLLLVNGFRAPSTGLIPDQHKHTYTLDNGYVIKHLDKKCAEQVYDELLSQTPPQKSSGFDFHDFSEKLSEAEANEMADKMKDTLVSAALVANEKGCLSKSLQRLVDMMTKPKLRWNQIVKKFIVATLVYDYSFSRPSRKFPDIIIPGPIKENVELVVHVDTSGSINDNILQQFLSECKAIVTSHRNMKMTLIECDCEIQQVLEVTSRNLNKLNSFKMMGGGGTSHKPVWEYIKRKIPRCAALVSLTDLYSDVDLSDRPRYPVLFVSNGVEKAPFGRVIKIEV